MRKRGKTNKETFIKSNKTAHTPCSIRRALLHAPARVCGIHMHILYTLMLADELDIYGRALGETDQLYGHETPELNIFWKLIRAGGGGGAII